MDYSELFDVRGQSYDQAMRAFPDARRQEFQQVIDRASLVAGMHVADVPAGGGYMARFLPRGCIWHGHEPSAGFTSETSQHRQALESRALLPLPWRTNAMDAAISLAGVHHMDDKRALFVDLRRVVKSGGRFVLSDVEAESPQARFLDGYVGDRTPTGHDGLYLDATTESELEYAGWRCLANERVSFHWVFKDRNEMGTFCRNLFGLNEGSLHETLGAIESRLGVNRLADGGVGMRWALRTIVAE